MIIDTSLFYMELENNVAMYITMAVGIVLIYGILGKCLEKGTKK